MKVRGNAQQVVDKYQALAREAATAGDPVMAENYYQHAEHYFRLMTANGGDNRHGGRPDGDRGRENGADNGADEGDGPSNDEARLSAPATGAEPAASPAAPAAVEETSEPLS